MRLRATNLGLVMTHMRLEDVGVEAHLELVVLERADETTRRAHDLAALAARHQRVHQLLRLVRVHRARRRRRRYDSAICRCSSSRALASKNNNVVND